MSREGPPKTDYSKIAEYYDRVRPTPADFWVQKVIEYGTIEPRCNVLDIGCGTGRFPRAISDSKMPVTCALDISAEMLEKAMENDASRSISWILGDGQTLPFRDEVFDCVYMTLVIHHIEDKITTLMEAHRSMRKGGRFVTLTNSHDRLRKSVLRYFPGVITIDLARFPTLPQLKRAMEDAGFRDVHYHAVHHNEYTPTAEYLERVKQRHVSTLTLLSDEDFQRGYEVFRQRILVNFGDRVLRHSGFDFVEGRK